MSEETTQETATGSLQTNAEVEFPSYLDSETGNFSEDWVEKLPESFADYRKTLSSKHFSSPQDMITAYVNLEQKMGLAANADFVKKPDLENATEDEIAQWRSAIGVPEDADGYNINMPEEMPEGITWNDDLAASLKQVLHENNAPAGLAEQLVAWDLNRQMEAGVAAQASQEAAIAEGRKELQKAWGSDYEANLKQVDGAVRQQGFDPEDPALGQFLSDPAAVQLLHSLSAHYKEDTLETGEGTAPSSDEALYERLTDPATAEGKLYHSEDDTAAVRQIRARVERLGLKLQSKRGNKAFTVG